MSRLFEITKPEDCCEEDRRRILSECNCEERDEDILAGIPALSRGSMDECHVARLEELGFELHDSNAKVGLFSSQALMLEGPPDTDNWGLQALCKGPGSTDTRVTSSLDDTSPSFDYTTTGAGVRVALMDSGTPLPTHTEFAGAALNEQYTAYGSYTDVYGHATEMASYIRGNTYGVAKDCIIDVYRAFGSSGQSSVSTVNNAFSRIATDYASYTEPCVVNLSFGAELTSNPHNAAMTTLFNAGVPMVAAAGNNNLPLDQINVWPANAGLDENGENGLCMTVTTSLRNWQKAVRGNFGPRVSIAAPTGNTRTAINTGGTKIGSDGTSQAAAMVSGCLARLLEGKPRPTNGAEVIALYKSLLDKAKPFQGDNTQLAGFYHASLYYDGAMRFLHLGASD